MWVAVAAVGAAVVGGVIASDSSRKASNTAADQAQTASELAAKTQVESEEKARQDFAPFLKAGTDVGLPGLTRMAGEQPVGQEYVNALKSLGTDFNLEASPFYQGAKSELLKTLGNQYSARGLSGSSVAEDALIRNQYPLMTQEYGRQYNALTDLYNLDKDMSGTQYGRYLDLAKIGAGAAQSAGQASLATGANLSNIYGNQGQQQAANTLAQGQQQANFYSGLGALPMQAYSAYQMGQQPKQQTYQPYQNAFQSYNQGGSGGLGQYYSTANWPTIQ